MEQRFIIITIKTILKAFGRIHFFFLVKDFVSPGSQCTNELLTEESQLVASSEWSNYYSAKNGMLHHQQRSGRAGSWLALRTDGNQWLQVNLPKVSKISIISSQGRADAGNWVKAYTIDYSVYGNTFQPYMEGGKRKVSF